MVPDQDLASARLKIGSVFNLKRLMLRSQPRGFVLRHGGWLLMKCADRGGVTGRTNSLPHLTASAPVLAQLRRFTPSLTGKNTRSRLGAQYARQLAISGALHAGNAETVKSK